MSLVVTYFTSSLNGDALYEAGAGVFTVIGAGWLILWLLYYLVDYLFIQGWERRCSEELYPNFDSTETASSNFALKKDTDIHAQEISLGNAVNEIEASIIVPLPPRRVSTLAAAGHLSLEDSLSPASSRPSIVSIDSSTINRASASKRMIGPRPMPLSISEAARRPSTTQ